MYEQKFDKAVSICRKQILHQHLMEDSIDAEKERIGYKIKYSRDACMINHAKMYLLLHSYNGWERTRTDAIQWTLIVRCNSCLNLFSSCTNKHRIEDESYYERSEYEKDESKCIPKNEIYSNALGFFIRNDVNIDKILSDIEDHEVEREAFEDGNNVYDLSVQYKRMTYLKSHLKWDKIPGVLRLRNEVLSDEKYASVVASIEPKLLNYNIVMRCNDSDISKMTQKNIKSCKFLSRAFT